jgi:hypothetical protein
VVLLRRFGYLFVPFFNSNDPNLVSDMENWIGIGIWLLMGAVIGLGMRVVIDRPEEQPGHAPIIAVLGAFGALVGGMLGVGIFHLYDPVSLSAGGMGGAAVLATFMTFIYRWGLRTLI